MADTKTDRTKGILLRVLPWIVTGGILAFLYTEVGDVEEVGRTLSEVRWVSFAVLIAVYSFSYFLVDSFAIQQAYAWFNIRIPYSDILPIRAVTYILWLASTTVGQGGVAAYVSRRHRVPFPEALGTMLFNSVAEISQLTLLSFVGLFVLARWFFATAVPEETIYGFGVLYLTVFLGFTFLVLYARFGLDPIGAIGRALRIGLLERWGARIRGSGPLRPFRRARPLHYLGLVAIRSVAMLLAVVVYSIALRLFGITIDDWWLLLGYLPAIFLAASLPIAAGHIGPPSLLWVAFFSAYAGREELIAFSLVVHPAFVGMNSLIGLVFLRRATREITQGAEPGGAPPLGGER